jgi:predicted RNase H-like HicB family nuclease
MKKYAIIVYWSDEDAVWIAEAPDLEPCAAHGNTPEQAVAELRVAVDLWLEVAREKGQPIPDKRWDDLFQKGPRTSEDFMTERAQPPAEKREPL